MFLSLLILDYMLPGRLGLGKHSDEDLDGQERVERVDVIERLKLKSLNEKRNDLCQSFLGHPFNYRQLELRAVRVDPINGLKSRLSWPYIK